MGPVITGSFEKRAPGRKAIQMISFRVVGKEIQT